MKNKKLLHKTHLTEGPSLGVGESGHRNNLGKMMLLCYVNLSQERLYSITKVFYVIFVTNLNITLP